MVIGVDLIESGGGVGYCPRVFISNYKLTTYMLRCVRHLMTTGCHGASPTFKVYLLARSLPVTLDLFLRASRSYPTRCVLQKF